MPQIIVAADRGAAFGEGAVTFRERVNVADFESAHFATQLLERLGWAVEDADAAERDREQQPAEDAAQAEHGYDERGESEDDEPDSVRQDPIEIPAPGLIRA